MTNSFAAAESDEMKKLNRDLLDRFMTHFFGYGSFNAKVWLVGMEEGAGRGFAEVEARLHAWTSRGEAPLEDVRDYHLAFGLDEAFTTTKSPERTWGRPIRLLLAAGGRKATSSELLSIQRESWARSNGTVCLAELLPLPNQTVEHWRYGDWTDHPDLQSRPLYEKKWKHLRRQALIELVKVHRPSVVIFHSKSNRPHWSKIARSDFVLLSPELDLSIAETDGTTFAMVRNPGDWLPESYFERVGAALGSHVGACVFEDLF